MKKTFVIDTDTNKILATLESNDYNLHNELYKKYQDMEVFYASNNCYGLDAQIIIVDKNKANKK